MSRESAAASRQNRIARGICIGPYCTSRPEEGRKRCKKCLKKQSRNTMRWKRRNGRFSIAAEVTEDLLERVDKAREELDLSRGAVVRIALRQFLKNRENANA